MDNKSDEQLLVIEVTIEDNKQESDKNHKETADKITLPTEKQNETNETLKLIMATMNKDKNNISKSSPSQKDTLTPPEPTTRVQTNKRSPPLEGGISKNIGGMWTLKHEISLPIFYELIIKTELKGDTALDIKNFYNHIKMSLNEMIRLIVDLLPDYQSINRHSVFKECFVPDRNHTPYSWNLQVYTSIGHSLFVAITNNTCVKCSTAVPAYKVVSIHVHEISEWTILYRLIHSRDPHLGRMNGNVQYYLATLAFRNGEQLEYFHIRILRFQQESMLSGEIISPTRLLFQYMESLKIVRKSKYLLRQR